MVALLGVALEPCQEDAPRELKSVESIAQSGKTREAPAPNPSNPTFMEETPNRLTNDGEPGEKGSERHPHRVALMQPDLTHLICQRHQAANTDPKLMV
jgi:hypothetical protein